MKRRRLIKLATFTQVGLAITIVERTLSAKDFQGSSIRYRETQTPSKSSQQDTQSILKNQDELKLSISEPIEVVSVDAKGQIIAINSIEIQYFTEDLGNGVTLEMVSIPGGSFTMGSPTTEIGHNSYETPQHQVTISPFFISKFPITQKQWEAVANLTKIDRTLNVYPSYFKGENLPVETVSWYEAIEFCQRLSTKSNRKYWLPSEAQWEYAARAGSTSPYHFGATITSALANYNSNYTFASESVGEYRGKTTTVGSFSPNFWGLYDMHGLVWEWCIDDWSPNYEEAPTDGRARILNNTTKPLKTIRGGCWYDSPSFCRSANREYLEPNYFDNHLGFRVVYVDKPS